MNNREKSPLGVTMKRSKNHVKNKGTFFRSLKTKRVLREEHLSLIKDFTNEKGDIDLIGINNKIHTDIKNPTMEEFFGNVGIDNFST